MWRSELKLCHNCSSSDTNMMTLKVMLRIMVVIMFDRGHMSQCTCGSQRTTLESHFSPSTIISEEQAQLVTLA